MSKRRLYVHVSEINYRGLKRLGVYSGECPGLLVERLIAELVAHHQLTDESFCRWLEAEQRDITYSTHQERVGPPRQRHPPTSPQPR